MSSEQSPLDPERSPNGSSLAGPLGEYYAGLIKDMVDSRVSMTETAMEGVRGLAAGFAAGMRDSQMPVDRAKEDIYEPLDESDRMGRLVESVSHPFWIIVRDSDLSGRALRHAHKSIWFHGHRQSIEAIDPADALTQKLRVNARITYYEKAFGVSSQGDLVRLLGEATRSYDDPRPLSREDISFWVNPKAVQSSDLFDVNVKIDPKSLISKMDARVKQAAKHYGERRYQELESMGIIARDDSYYKPISTVHEAGPEQSEVHRSFWRRILPS